MFVTNEQYIALRERYDDYAKSGFPGLDAGLQQVLEIINTVDGLISLWSCSGHVTEGQETNLIHMTNANVILAVRDQHAFDRLYRIYENMLSVMSNHYQHMVKLKLSRLVWPMSRDSDDIRIWYPTVELSVIYYIIDPATENETQRTYIDLFMYAIKKELFL